MFKDISVALYFSNVCNLSCKYCYLQIKNGKLDVDVVDYIKSDRWIHDIQKHCPDMEHIGFWGAEPTLRLSLIEKHVPNFKILFPKLNHITTSSNFVNIDSLKSFVNLLPEDLEFFIQVSLDGDKEVSSFGRGDYYHDKIISNVLDFASYIKGINKKIIFQNRSTWNKEMLRYLANKDNFIRNLDFFKNLKHEIITLLGDKEYRIELAHMIAFPYTDYIKEDGINFSTVLQNILDLDDSMGFPYKQIIKDLYKNNLFSWMNISMSTCSAGKSAFGLFDGNIYPCHSLFNNFEEFVLYSNRETMKRHIQTINNYHSLQIANDRELVKQLLNAGLVQKNSCKDNLIDFVSVMSKVICYLEAYSAKKSFYVNPAGTFQLFLNGAIERLIELDGRRKATYK